MTAEPTRVPASSRVIWLRVILACALAAGFLLSPKLWLSARSYPLSPVLPWLPTIPAPLDMILFVALFAALAMVVAVPRRRAPIVAFLVMAGVLAIWDQSRWQPWFYQYCFMLGALALPRSATNGQSGAASEAALNIGRIIIAATYFWSGIHKLNPIFMSEGFGFMIEPLTSRLPAAATPILMYAALPSAILESLVGLGLLIRPLRMPAVILALAMHIFILFSIGPFGRNWNTVVWPWNVAMMLFVVILFWSIRDVPVRTIVWPGRRPYHALVLILFGFMPLLSFLDLWDTSLSASLYSGNAIRGTLQISDEVRQRLPAEIQAYVRRNDRGEYRIEISAWSMDELNIPAYPATRVYRDIARTICPYGRSPGDVVLSIRQRPRFLSGKRDYVTYDCSQM